MIQHGVEIGHLNFEYNYLLSLARGEELVTFSSLSTEHTWVVCEYVSEDIRVRKSNERPEDLNSFRSG